MSDKFTPLQPLNTAVLFLVFNRLDTTKQVFEAIKEAKPPRLYIAADGARTSKEGEAEKVSAVRDFILQNIDWECEVKMRFREKNYGCKMAVSEAIDWFFENEEMGIILEDDCLPNQSFFWYCEELLEKYKQDSRIGQISGTNILGDFHIDGGSYHFSNYGSIWGWATWKRAWKYYDVNMKSWPFVRDNQLLKATIFNSNEMKSRSNAFEQTYQNKIDTWDYQWIYSRIINRMLIVIPGKNLISNIGFGEDATHTSDINSNLSSINNCSIKLPLIHPKCFLPNLEFENKAHLQKTGSLHIRLIRKIKLIVRKIWAKK